MRLSILPRPRFPRPCTQLLLLSHASGCAAALMMLPSCQPPSPIVPPEPLGLLLMGNLPQCIAALICHLHCQDDNYRCFPCTWIIVLHCLQTEQSPTFAAKIAALKAAWLIHPTQSILRPPAGCQTWPSVHSQQTLSQNIRTQLCTSQYFETACCPAHIITTANLSGA